ncbi:hypothetical protein DACRYDRAFT_41877, partial [Dacryopinax primogenitus]
WKLFHATFERAFSNPDQSGTAHAKLEQLSQGNKTANEYIAMFRELAEYTNYNDIAHIEKFEQGLNHDLVDKIYSLAEMPEDLEGWYCYASHFD